MNQVLQGIDGVRTGVHICRGNWSRKEEVLLSGDYARLLPALEAMQVDQLVLEYATPRAGDIAVVGEMLARDPRKQLGLGVVNPRTDEPESVEQIVALAALALEYLPPERIFLNPDCGFACFASRGVNSEEVAALKLQQIARAAAELRRVY